MDKLEGEISSIVFTSADKSFSVIKVLSPTDKVTVVGTLPDLDVGEQVQITGKWVSHPNHGKQFEAFSVTVKDPDSLAGIEKFIISIIKGIGPKYAKKIVEYFKDATCDVLDNSPERLGEIAGIGKKRVLQIKDEWHRKREQKKEYYDVIGFCATKNISQTYADKIYHLYGKDSRKVLQENPYRLAIDIKGIGFKLADKFASNFNFAKNSPKRIIAGIEYILHLATQFGHTCLPQDILVGNTADLLQIELVDAEKKLKRLLDDNLLALEDGKVSTLLFHNLELNIAAEIKRLMDHPKQRITSLSFETMAIQPSKQQLQALHNIFFSKIHLLTGGPGTGKTTILATLVQLLDKNSKKYCIAAPTGKAAQRLSAVTKKYTRTIHGLLELDPVSFNFKRNSKNPLEADFVIIDESSMIDTRLFYALLQAIPNNAHLVLIGDVDQIPSIGAGNILSDLIEAAIPTTKLTEIFRQSKHSLIIKNAHLINNSEFPILKNSKDFLFYEYDDTETIKRHILYLVQKELPQKYGFHPLNHIQILAPMRKGPLGINEFNNFLQAHINPIKQHIVAFGNCFKLHDKVIQMQNNYHKNVFNGNIGTITRLDPINTTVTINFNLKDIEYPFDELDQISLAYAISIHKYQGSEAPCIILPLHMSYFKMLQRKLLYTAITRAKKLVVILGQKKAIATALHNRENLERYTKLALRLNALTT